MINLNSEANRDVDSDYLKIFSKEEFFVIINKEQKPTVNNLLNLAAKAAERGDYIERPDLPGDFYALKNLIRYIDVMCDEIGDIDNRLASISDIYKSSISEATIVSISAAILPTVTNLRKLGQFSTVNTDYLNHF